MMRWVKRIALIVGGLIVVSVLAGASYEQIMRWRAAREFPAQGRLIDIGGRRMQIDCRGSGTPIVVFEAGLDSIGSLSWSAVHDAVAATTRACAYSRAGIMWSEPRAGKFEPDSVARDLHALLVAAGERAPFVMVGHSLGGPYIMNFTRLYPQEVAGLVFVDASHPEQLERMAQAAGKKMDMGKGMLKTADALSWTGIPRLVETHTVNPTIPAQAKLAEDAYFSRSLSSALQELESLDATLSAAGRLRQLEDRPMVVLTATKPYPAATLKAMQMTTEQGLRIQAAWKEMHNEEASWSHRSRHELVPNATHYIQFDRPDVVIAAVREVVADIRSEGVTGGTPAAEVTVVSNVLGPEGPLYVDGNLYYVGWVSNTLSKWDGKSSTVLNSLAGCSHNGLALTPHKTFLLACTDNHGAILELDMNGKQLRRWDADSRGNKFEGGINDVMVTAHGGAYATVFGPPEELPTAVAGKILYLAPGAQQWIEAARDLNYANGIGISPDQKTLYVSETVGNCILKFEVNRDGTLKNRSNFALLNLLTPNKANSWWLGPDSMKIDAKGNMYVAQWFGGKILKISPQGKLLRQFEIAAGDGTTNVAFGPDEKDLYVTVVKDPNDPRARGSVVRIAND
jgi:sugar lactone lactonase YvrE/pimeloyl-ACP methyl ester carboxylesterase